MNIFAYFIIYQNRDDAGRLIILSNTMRRLSRIANTVVDSPAVQPSNLVSSISLSNRTLGYKMTHTDNNQKSRQPPICV